MDLIATDLTATEAALDRLIEVACSDTGQARRVGNFLLAWWNGPARGAITLAPLVWLDASLGRDIATIIGFLAGHPSAIYPDAFGRRDAMDALVARWRPELLNGEAAR